MNDQHIQLNTFFRTGDIRKRTEQATIAISGLDTTRAARYLGLSKIGWCLAHHYDLHFGRQDASAPGLSAHLRCMSGYMYEDKMLQILERAGIAKPRPIVDGKTQEFFAEVTPPFSTAALPVRGHTDGETTREFGEQLIEITTAGADEFRSITRSTDPDVLMHAIRNKMLQIQAYLRWGKNESGKPYNHCLFVLVSRGEDHDPMRWWFYDVSKQEKLGDQVEYRLIKLVGAILKTERPACECVDKRHAAQSANIAARANATTGFDSASQPTPARVVQAVMSPRDDDYLAPRHSIGGTR